MLFACCIFDDTIRTYKKREVGSMFQFHAHHSNTMSEIKGDFSIVLPSNSNMTTHPGNRPDDYLVRLGKAITLTGDWEVALLNIQYPHNWFDVREKAVIHWVYSKNRIALTDEQIAAKVKLQYEPQWKACTVSLTDPDWNYARDFRHTAITLWPGHYTSVQEIGDRVCRLIEDGIKQSDLKQNPRIIFSFDFETRSGALHTSMGTLYLFAESTYIANLLGIKANRVTPQQTDEVASIEIPQIYMLSGPGKSNFAKLDSIYVYGDIVENQLVGDTEAKLLGIVPIQKRTEEKQFFSFNPPLYLPVSKTNFSDVKIELKTPRGESIPFPKFTPNVACTLRFRRRKNYF
jgi:hypothetical protein